VHAAELLDTVQELQYRLGQTESHVELGEKTESTLREEHERLLADLERERERANQSKKNCSKSAGDGFDTFLGST
jgi:hypothetical protein